MGTKIYCSARLERLTVQQLAMQSRHARREDATGQMRSDPMRRERTLHWSQYVPDDPTDYGLAFQRMKEKTGAKERPSTSPVSHVLVQVSPEWITKEGGDLHDPSNPRNRRLMDAAGTWIAKTFGMESILALRLDLDETGGACVDAIIAPVIETKTGKKQLSVSKRLRELQKKTGARNTFAALQDSLAAYLQAHLDPGISRGKTKTAPGKDRLSPEIYGATRDLEKLRQEITRAQNDLTKIAQAAEGGWQLLERGYMRVTEGDDGHLVPVWADERVPPESQQRLTDGLAPVWDRLAPIWKDACVIADRTGLSVEQVRRGPDFG